MTTTPVAANDPAPQKPPPPPPTPPKPAPASPRPPSGPPRRELVVARAEHRVDLLDGTRLVASAIRTLFGWHVPRGRNAHGERVWQSHDTLREALAGLFAIAMRGT